MAPAQTNSGIVTDATSGDRQIPESVRSDGSTRKAIKIRPGFRPAEDVELYRARNAVAQRERRRMGVPGATAPEEKKPEVKPEPPAPAPAPRSAASLSWRRAPDASADNATGTVYNNGGSILSPTASSNKNAKRREARKKAKSTEPGEATKEDTESTKKAEPPKAEAETVDQEVEREKKVRNLKKKLKQAKDLKNKKDEGEGLLPEQIAKVIKINELVRELEALGFDGDGEPKDSDKTKAKADA